MRKIEVYLGGKKQSVLVWAREGDVQFAAARGWIGKLTTDGDIFVIGGQSVVDIDDIRKFLMSEFPEWDEQMCALALDALGPICFPPVAKRVVEVFF